MIDESLRIGIAQVLLGSTYGASQPGAGEQQCSSSTQHLNALQEQVGAPYGCQDDSRHVYVRNAHVTAQQKVIASDAWRSDCTGTHGNGGLQWLLRM
jgi:hypothetical protein